jgi:beta-glucanase (GH16 family)
MMSSGEGRPLLGVHGIRWTRCRSHVVGVLAAALVLAVGVTVAAAARSNDFREEFASLDASRWVTVGRPAGLGRVEPANVGVTDGRLAVRLPAGRLDGGEVRTVAQYRFGTYRARLKTADAPSSITAFYLYGTPDFEREIDIELWNDGSRRIMFTTYSNGRQTNNVTRMLPFDPAADFHEYTIDYRPGSVRFLVDGALMQQFASGVTRAAMHVFVTAWFPFWLEGQAPPTDRLVYVDWIEFVGR